MAPATNDRRVRTLVAVVAGLGATTLTLTVLPSWGRGFGELRLLGLTLLCLAAVNAHRVTFPWKGQSEQISADEIFFIAIVVMSPPPGVAAAVVFASVFGSLRFRLPRIKALFDLGCYAVSLSLALAVTSLVAGGVPTEDDTSLETLHRLRALGVRIAIDDFGTGYSSLSRLRTLPADVVKIDQSFVREITDAHAPVPLVTSTLGMAHGLGLEVVAEGVETPEQLRFLTEKGCEMAQGYLLGRPMAADKLEALLLRSPVVREPELAPRT